MSDPPPPPEVPIIVDNPLIIGAYSMLQATYHRRFYCDWLEKTSLVDRFSREKLVRVCMLEDVYWALGLQSSMGKATTSTPDQTRSGTKQTTPLQHSSASH